MYLEKTNLVVWSLALLLGVGGCGGGDNGSGSDGGMNADGGMPGDAGTDASMDDGGAEDAGPVGNAYEAFADATEGLVADNCTCDFMGLGFDSTEACVAANTAPMEVVACARDAIDSADAQVQAYHRCQAAAFQSFLDCVDGVACDDAGRRRSCGMTASDMLDACPDPNEFTAAMDAFLDAVGSCVAGSGGSCPDGDAASSMLGEGVFSGSTIGAGDQVNRVRMDGSACPSASFSADRTHLWRAPEAGVYRFDTVGSGFDTILRLLSGCPDGSETELACNDDIALGNLRSQVEREFAADEEALVVVEGFDGVAAGDYQVNVTKLLSGCPNDEMPATATGMEVFSGQIDDHADDLANATDGCTRGGAADVVLRWTAPSAGDWVIDTAGSEFDTVLYVKESCEADTDLACNDDVASGDQSSRVTVSLTAGQTIFVVVEAFSAGARGRYVVNVHPASMGGGSGMGGG